VAPASSDAPAEEIDLVLAFQVVHRTVNLGDAASEAHAFEAANEKVERVAMFGEDQNLLIPPSWIADDFAQLL
jgi:hypothetical protein